MQYLALYSGKTIDTAEIVAAAEATPDALRDAFQMSVDGDDENGILLALQAARAKGLEDLVAHIVTVREDLGELLAEVAEADAVEDIDIESRFELVAEGKMPSRAEILGGPQSDINTYSQMR